MSTPIPDLIVNEAKNKLKTIFLRLETDEKSEIYDPIRLCFNLFFMQVTVQVRWSKGHSYQNIDSIQMEPRDAIDKIKNQVIPWLQKADILIRQTSPYWDEFKDMIKYFRVWFCNDTQPHASDKVEDLQSEIVALRFNIKEILSYQSGYADERIHMNQAITELQEQMKQIMNRLKAVEAKDSATLHTIMQRVEKINSGP
jgi:hypothetical protein